LHRNIAQRRRFDRTGDDRPADGIRDELVEKPVARAAADDPQVPVTHAGQFLEPLESNSVLECQAFENGARAARGIRRRGLPGVAAELRNRGRHVGRMKEGRVIWIEQRPKGVPLVGSAGHEFLIRSRQSLPRPGPCTRLENPQAADVLEQPRCPADAAFVREIQIPRLRADNRRLDLCTKQRPCA
jgi:hypothetical protein